MPLGRDLLTSSRQLGLTRMDANGWLVEQPANPLPTVRDYRKIERDGAGRIWVANKMALFRLEGPVGGLRIKFENLPSIFPCDPCPKNLEEKQHGRPAQVADIEIDTEGRPWVGYGGGIAWLGEDGAWHRVPTERPVLDVRAFALSADTLWVAGRLADEFYKIERRGPRWPVKSFDPARGYGPAATFFLKFDSRGWLWRGSTDGVHIADGKHLRPEDWLHLDTANGLVCGEADNYGFFEDTDHSVWIAGAQGITHLHPSTAWFQTPPGIPSIQAITKPGAGRLRVEAQPLNPPSARQYPFRCRLSGADWKLSPMERSSFTD